MLGTLTASLPPAKPLCFSSATCHPSDNSVRFLRTATPSAPGNQSRASIRAFTQTETAVIETRRPASLYDVLRVNRNASPMEIKSAYRSLAKVYHPDSLHRPESDGKDFIQIHNAYATLSDPSARELYDLSLQTHRRRQPFAYSVENQVSGFYTTRRWETDQCW
ncbi:Chaperone protein dnaJ 11 like [Quillaja saponaria]|uniref:Chaperone protein dnaJ 11 like n=1 Tax=Quillaja saponaria TaxID=32244 RepID=A0AAD7LSV1_QUISA|nr:Chaperone protein dnaJ 11 like [Quillaja saponaria]